jgi:FkbM family methyltransferase
MIPLTYHAGSGGLRPSIKPIIKWALKLGLAWAQPSEFNYLLLSPPFQKRQTVRDRRSGKVSTFLVRDECDYGVLEQVYGNEDYRLDRLARSAEILATYQRLRERNRTPLIIDCGANIGLSSRYFADTFPAAKVVGIEPDRQNYLQALKNCAHPDVEFRQAAVASECKRGSLVDPGLGNWGLRVNDDENGALDLLSINSLIADARYAHCAPFIIKIDIEGFEAELFSKNLEWLERFPLLIIELHDWLFPAERNSHNVLKVLARLDRDFVFFGENVFSIANRMLDPDDARERTRSAVNDHSVTVNR